MYKYNLKSHRVQHYQRHCQQTLGVKMASVRLTWLRQPIKSETWVEATFLYLWLCTRPAVFRCSLIWSFVIFSTELFSTCHCQYQWKVTTMPVSRKRCVTSKITRDIAYIFTSLLRLPARNAKHCDQHASVCPLAYVKTHLQISRNSSHVLL